MVLGEFRNSYPISRTGISVLGLSKSNLSNYKLLYPTHPEQVVISNFLFNLDAQITTKTQKLEQLKQLKTAYMQKMFV